jgi:hypothetical protein
MRARNLKPGFFSDERVTNCCFSARLLFQGLWCLADMDGILREKPKEIKAKIFPVDKVSIERHLAELEKHGLILRYCVDGEKFISIPNFRRHQKPYKNERQSTLPKPPRKQAQNEFPKGELKENLGQSKGELKENLGQSKGELKENLGQSKGELSFSTVNAESVNSEKQKTCETESPNKTLPICVVPCSLFPVPCSLSPVSCSDKNPPAHEEKKTTVENTIQTAEEPFQSPTVKEKPGFDFSFEGLAKHFWETQKGGKETLDVVDETMAELIRVGFSPGRIREEIDDPERLATQRTWEFARPFKDQLRDRKRPRPKTVEERLREHMEKAKSAKAKGGTT